MPSYSRVIKGVVPGAGRREIPVVLELPQSAVEQVEVDLSWIQSLEAEARELVDKAHQQAREIVAAAESERQVIFDESRAEGSSQGYLEGLKQADQQAAATRQEAIDVLHQAQQLHQDILAGIQQEAVDLAVIIAERVVRRQLEIAPEAVLAIAREIMQRSVQSSYYILIVNPQDVTLVREQRQQLLEAVDHLAQIQVLADPAITPGGCRVETEQGYCDGTIEAQLQVVHQTLKAVQP